MKRWVILLLSALMVLSMLWLPGSLGGIKEAKAETFSLDGCTEYPIKGIAKLLKDTTLQEYPYADADSVFTGALGIKTKLKTSENTSMTVLTMYKNKYGNYWYKVDAKSGSSYGTGYLYAEHVQITTVGAVGFSLDNPTNPSEIVKGNGFHIKGTIKSSTYTITGVYAYVYKSGDNVLTATPVISSKQTGLSTKSYKLYDSTVDNSLKFGNLAAGNYQYCLKVAFQYTYSKDGKNLTTANWSKTAMVGAEPITVKQFEIHTSTFKVLETYAVKYNANGGTGAPSAQTKVNGRNLTLSSTKPTRESTTTTYIVTLDANGGSVSQSSINCPKTTSYSFAHWNTASDGSGTSYSPGATYSKNANLTLYARWNTSSSTTRATLPTPTRAGYTFDGWYTAASGGTYIGGAGDTYGPTANITFYAHWTRNNYTVSFNANGGSCGTASKTVTYGGTYGDLPTPTWTGHDFSGWYTASSGGSQVYTSTTVTATANHTLYAHWTIATASPTITTQPTSVTTSLGATATFKVAASNATSYQWQYQKPGDSTWYDAQANGKSATFNQTNVETRHNGFVFRCKVSGAGGTVYSNTATLTVQVPTTPPTITSQPSAVTKDVGYTATFKVTASNAASYQWQYQKPGDSTWYNVLDNGKSATFNQTNLEKRHNGFLFRCKVTNAIGSVYSNTAKLTVPTEAPTITSQPAAVTKDVGYTATFTVVATGATGYQWQYQKPGDSTWYNVLDNGKSATFNQTNLQKRHDGFLFRCKVSNAVGSTYSNTAKLTVPTTAPTISSHPAAVTKDLGATATFKVTAANATSYQWQYQIPGNSTWNDVQNNGKSATFNQTNVEKRHNGYLFRCKVTNGVGSTYSNTAKLTVPTTAPTITGQPSSVSTGLGTTASFKVTASNATSYQWQYQIPGSSTWNDVQNNGKSAVFNQTDVAQRHNGYLFRCKVTNSIGSTYSNSAKLTVVTAAPTITGQPSSVTTGLGTTASFKVTATNASSYQWQYQKPGDSTWYDVQNNGKSAVFNQTDVEQRHNGFLFRCKVTNALGSVYSNAAKLTVQ